MSLKETLLINAVGSSTVTCLLYCVLFKTRGQSEDVTVENTWMSLRWKWKSEQDAELLRVQTQWHGGTCWSCVRRRCICGIFWVSGAIILWTTNICKKWLRKNDCIIFFLPILGFVRKKRESESELFVNNRNGSRSNVGIAQSMRRRWMDHHFVVPPSSTNGLLRSGGTR